jgi:hypothetical protein
MVRLGGYMLFFGIGSIILNFIGLQFIVLSWIDYWGDSTAWLIRIGMIVVGGFLWWWAGKREVAAL